MLFQGFEVVPKCIKNVTETWKTLNVWAGLWLLVKTNILTWFLIIHVNCDLIFNVTVGVIISSNSHVYFWFNFTDVEDLQRAVSFVCYTNEFCSVLEVWNYARVIRVISERKFVFVILAAVTTPSCFPVNFNFSFFLFLRNIKLAPYCYIWAFCCIYGLSYVDTPFVFCILKPNKKNMSLVI